MRLRVDGRDAGHGPEEGQHPRQAAPHTTERPALEATARRLPNVADVCVCFLPAQNLHIGLHSLYLTN